MRENTVGVAVPLQFDLVSHYDAMEQLDADVHDDIELSRTESCLALRLIAEPVRSVFLPCFGTGRHIPHLLEAGVQRIVGVDLSPKCVAKAQHLFGHLRGVELQVANLLAWSTFERFDATILLGNSFGDIIDPKLLGQVTAGMLAPLKPGGVFIMDYIGQEYLDRCHENYTAVWTAKLDGSHVHDRRTPRFDAGSSVMTIDVVASDMETNRPIWQGGYQKLVLADDEICGHFNQHGVRMVSAGRATSLNTDYYNSHEGELGMIACSTWWVGHKVCA